ncbi:MAG TPA: hypothetical protein PKV06_08445, partial [bacterium]|nr:hypothetical protein [bacterium]
VVQYELIAYTMEDGRKVRVHFSQSGNSTKIVSVFDAEQENPVDMQKNGWQAILDNFAKYVVAV